MRAGIGILSLLIAVAIILMVAFSGPGGGVVPNTLRSGKVAESQANQISGHDDSGMRVQDSIVLDEDSSNGKFRGLIVRSVVATGPMATAYGLMPGDKIVEVGPMNARDFDPELMKAEVYESYGHNQPLVIERAGQKLTINPNSPLTAAHPNLFPAPGITAPGATSNGNLPSGNVQNIPTH